MQKTINKPLKNPLLLRSALAIVLVILVFSCGKTNTVIVTNLPEVLEYLEYVRESVSPPHFDVVFNTNLHQSRIIDDINPDIIISDSIAHEDFASYFFNIPFSRLRKHDGKNTDSFIFEDIYPLSYEPFRKENAVYLIPLAFDLPIVFLSDEILPYLESTSEITYEELLEVSQEFTVIRGGNYSVMGFSTLRDMLFIDLLIREKSAVRGNLPQESDLSNYLTEIIQELHRTKQVPQSQIYFNEIFAYSSSVRNIIEGRLHASLSTFHRLIVEELPDNFPIAWLYADDYIEAMDPIYMGILRKSNTKGKSLEILRKLLSAKTQSAYLQKRIQGNLPANSFLNRLSSNRILNKFFLEQILDTVVIPDNILFPGKPIYLWKEIQNEIYYPWIFETLVAASIPIEAEESERTPSTEIEQRIFSEIHTETLSSAIENYYKLHDDF